MTIELRLLAWSLVLALVQVLLPAKFRDNETGRAYNVGPRDDPGPPVGKITGRLRRAQSNLYETLPLFGLAVVLAHVAGREGVLSLSGAWLYVLGRVAYLPLYAAGVPYIRSAVWLVSLIGLVLVLVAVLWP